MKISFLSTGSASVPLGLFVKGAGRRRVRFPLLCVLIERTSDLVLFDTGIGTRFNTEMRPLVYRGNWFFSRFIMPTRFDPSSDALVHQLKRLGYDRADVKYAVLSHLHWDHAGGMRDLPRTTFIVNRLEWEHATTRKGMNLFKGAYIKDEFDGVGLDVRLIDTDPARLYLGFAASHDVFGDGCMVLVDLPGHAPGQVGMVLNLPSGRRFFFTGDAFYFPESLEMLVPKSRLMSSLVTEGPEAEESLRSIWRVARDEPDMEIVSNHDHRIPGRYKLAPVSYE
jgi:glyoxylase-like metal-dependent hydrolase (beta-lactamase superfamily II)